MRSVAHAPAAGASGGAARFELPPRVLDCASPLALSGSSKCQSGRGLRSPGALARSSREREEAAPATRRWSGRAKPVSQFYEARPSFCYRRTESCGRWLLRWSDLSHATTGYHYKLLKRRSTHRSWDDPMELFLESVGTPSVTLRDDISMGNRTIYKAHAIFRKTIPCAEYRTSGNSSHGARGTIGIIDGRTNEKRFKQASETKPPRLRTKQIQHHAAGLNRTFRAIYGESITRSVAHAPPPGTLVALHNSGERWEPSSPVVLRPRHADARPTLGRGAAAHGFSGRCSAARRPGVRETLPTTVDIADFMHRSLLEHRVRRQRAYHRLIR